MGLLPGTTFDEFFEEFLVGHVPFGSYFDNVLSWYARRNDPNVLFFYYETLKERPVTVTLDIAEFLDARIAERLRGDEALLRYIVDKTSFGSLKASAISAISELGTEKGKAGLEKDRLDNLARNFFRKGEVGDWKRHLKPEQEQRLRRLCEERLKGTGMWRTWKKWFQ
ncbi:hypothetical protein V5799_007025 [Amblyomma americanum]|uniref:Sulfotransferase domain-containing protein n=1 Tax=Amblyomma americanum TaxID=6943 RepID=A0AAQ4DUQ5_AMBAM